MFLTLIKVKCRVRATMPTKKKNGNGNSVTDTEPESAVPIPVAISSEEFIRRHGPELDSTFRQAMQDTTGDLTQRVRKLEENIKRIVDVLGVDFMDLYMPSFKSRQVAFEERLMKLEGCEDEGEDRPLIWTDPKLIDDPSIDLRLNAARLLCLTLPSGEQVSIEQMVEYLLDRRLGQ